MKILHAISGIDPSAGGTATALLSLAAAQARAGLDVTVVSTYERPEPEAAESLRAQGVKVAQIGPAKWPLARHLDIIPKLRELIVDADLVHTHGMWEEIQHQAARLCRELHVPYVMSPHGMLDPWSLSQSGWRKRIYLAARMRRNLDGASAIHFTTQTERDLVARLELQAPAIVEANGVDIAAFENLPPRGTFRAKYPALGDRPMVLFLGRLHYKKGFDLLIPAFAKLKDSNAMLVIAGPDAEGYRNQIQKMIDQHRLGSRVVFTGMLRGSQRIEAFVDADLFVLPSYQENFGIAVVEALASGCPVIISDQVNICREVKAEKVGAVVPLKVEPLTEELNRWLGDRELRRGASLRGPVFVQREYDWNQIAHRWAKRYQELYAHRRPFYSSSLAQAVPEPVLNRLHVLHVIANLDYETGGPAIALAGLSRAQQKVGLDVTIVSTFPKNANLALAYELRRQGRDVHLIGPGKGKLVRHPQIAPTIRRLVARADVVHIHGVWEEIHHLAALEARRQDIPYIIRTCGMLDPWSLRQHSLRKKAYLRVRLRNDLNHAAAVHCTSDRERDLLDRLHLRSPRIVEPNGVELEEFDDRPPRGSFRKRYGGLSDRPIVLFLGRLHYKKGLDLLIPAFAAGTSGEVMLVIAGPDADGYRAKIERMVENYHLGDRVVFTGMLYGKERIEALADADLFVLPSYQENFGIAVVEALAAGCPVLVSDQVNIHEQITKAGVGGMHPTRVDAMAAELTLWMGNPALRESASNRARDFVREHYDWRAIAQRWAERYERLRGRRSASLSAAASSPIAT
ncbi:MAG TPA: glycosyltransferase [Tepidisphaeraceae bacterium]|jgi:glycosyltransferase involved in cell wall biosynthesis|nr:glycosyltransferase [Tepidisphaeraceae bacterium]